MKQRNFIFAATLLVAASCANKFDQVAPDGREIIITAYSDEENNGKTTLHDGGTSVYWQPGDEVKLFYDGTGGRFQAQTETESRVSKFSGTLNVFFGFDEGFADATPLWGLYPYRADATSDGESITTTLPSEQTGKAGSFASGTYITLGKSTSLSMGFYAVCGGLRFSLTKEGVTKVIFEAVNGEPIAGTFKTAFEDGVPVVKEITNASSIITLTAPNSGTFEKDKWYYIVALPGTLANGFKIRLETNTQYAKMTSSSSVTFKRAKFGSIEDIDEGLIFKDKVEAVDLGLPSGIKWASCNLGASKPEDYGGYYQWAGLEDVTSTSIYLDLSNCPYHTGSSYSTGWTKYIPSSYSSYWSGDGNPDNKTVLDPEDDVAHATLGGKWRMPTKAEIEELYENCTEEWTTLNGINGRKFTSKKNGNSIFLPAAGYRNQAYLDPVGDYGFYWSSTLVTRNPNSAYEFRFHSNYVYTDQYNGRYLGHSIRPVSDEDVIHVTGISLSKSSITLTEESSETLTATISPSNAYNQNVIWSSSDTNTATVDAAGLVTAIKQGTATITAKTHDGGYTAICSVTVIGPAVPEAVDLGLPSGLKWATCNIGAKSPEEYGDYYAWGETETKASYSENTYKFYKSETVSEGGFDVEYKGYTKYIPSSKASGYGFRGFYDNKTVLDPEDDVAHVKLGGKWRMPTTAEFNELNNNCQCDWVTYKGVKGRKFTSKKAGYTDKWIFLPAAGYRDDGSLSYVRSRGHYWSPSLYSAYPYFAYNLSFSTDGVGTGNNNYRYYGQSVRPVCE